MSILQSMPSCATAGTDDSHLRYPLITEFDDLAKIAPRVWGLSIGAVKGRADGSLGSRTAYFFEPFSDTPNNRGHSDEMQLPAACAQNNVQGRCGWDSALHACYRGPSNLDHSRFVWRHREEHGPADRRLHRTCAAHGRKDFDRFAQLGSSRRCSLCGSTMVVGRTDEPGTIAPAAHAFRTFSTITCVWRLVPTDVAL